MDTEELNEDVPDNEQIKENLIQGKNEEPDEEDEKEKEDEKEEEEEEEEVQIENRIKNNKISNEIQIEVKNSEVIIVKNGKNDDINNNFDDEDSDDDDYDNDKNNNNANLNNQNPNPNNNVSNENHINNFNNEQIKEFYKRRNHKKDVKVSAPIMMVVLIIIHYAPSFACFGELIINIGNNEEVGLEILESFFYIILWIALIFKIIFHKGSKRKCFPCCNVLSTISVVGLIILGIVSIVLFSKGGNSKTKFVHQIKAMLYIFIIAFDVIFFIIIIILIAASKKVNLSFIKIR